MPTTRRTIFIFSLERWGNMWYSKHHYAARLARDHEVFFVEFPERWRPRHLFSWRARTTTTPENVKVVTYQNTLPRKLGSFIGRWNGRKLMKLQHAPHPICWCFHPLVLKECEAMSRAGARVIYHPVDPYQSFPEDTPMARLSDLLVAINTWFFGYYAPMNPHRVLVPHGVRDQDRVADNAAADQWKSTYGRYALFAATLSKDTNYPLLIQAAKRFPSLRFLVAGSQFELPPESERLRDEWLALSNVTYIGVQHPNALKDLVGAAAVGLLAYDFEPRRPQPVSGVRTPLKVLTYLAQHCPLVTTNNSYIPQVEGFGCFKADDADEFLRVLQDVLDGRLKVDARTVDAYLDSVGYDTLITRILDALDEVRS